MVDLYTNINPTGLEKNPARDEIIQLLKKYTKLSQDIDSEAARLKTAKTEKQLITGLNRLKARADRNIQELMQSSKVWAEIAAPKSYLSGEALANSFIEKQSKIISNDGKTIKVFDLLPRDKALIKKTIDNVKGQMLREVQLINEEWRSRFDRIVREGMKKARGVDLELIKGVPKGKEIGTQLYREIEGKGIKLIDSIGRHWEPERYVRMYARTRTREIQTKGTRDRMEQYGFDLVQISEHVGACDDCIEYEGRVYSLSGKHSVYPELPMEPPFHPNCIHVMTPWVEKYQEAPEVIDYSAKYNNPEETPIYKEVMAGRKIDDKDLHRSRWGEQQDLTLKEIAESQGFTRKPRVVPEKQLNALIDDGAREVRRGVSLKEYSEQFKSGEYFAGTGVYGNGTYVAYGKNAKQVANAYAGKNGATIRFALDKNAKVIDFDKIEELREHFIREQGKAISNIFKKVKSEKDLMQLEKKVTARKTLRDIGMDEGRLAAMYGYDAIDVADAEYMVILNRGATIVSK